MNKIQSEEVNTPLLHQNVEETDSDEYSETDDFFESVYDDAEEAELEAEAELDEAELEEAELEEAELEEAELEAEPEAELEEAEEIKNIRWGQSEEIMCLDDYDDKIKDETVVDIENEIKDETVIDIENEIKDVVIDIENDIENDIEIEKKQKSKKNKTKRGRPSKQTVPN